MFCPECGSTQLDDARFCIHCGKSVRRAPNVAEIPPELRWEYMNLTIPIQVEFSVADGGDAFFQRFDDIVQQHLEYAAQDGWQPTERTDYHSLSAAGRVQKHFAQRRTLFNAVFGGKVEVCELVRIQVARPSPAGDPRSPSDSV
jgi:zinc-ribbon domain